MRGVALVLTLVLASLGAGPIRAESPQEPPATPQASSPPAAEPEPWLFTGTVLETMDAGIYTYFHLQTDTGKVWVASSKTAVEVGDQVHVPDGPRMVDFNSTVLDRRFDEIYLVAFVEVEGRKPTPQSIPEIHAGDPAMGRSAVDLSGISPAEGGQTVADVFAQRDALAGQEVSVRGKVVKVTTGVLGRNWIHLQDGTAGPGGENDLTVTTTENIEMGSTVLVNGVVQLDQDFGYGYVFALLVEASSVTTE